MPKSVTICGHSASFPSWLRQSPISGSVRYGKTKTKNSQQNTKHMCLKLLPQYSRLIFIHWIDLRENLNRKPWFLPSNIGLSCKFSHHPILWFIQFSASSWFLHRFKRPEVPRSYFWRSESWQFPSSSSFAGGKKNVSMAEAISRWWSAKKMVFDVALES